MDCNKKINKVRVKMSQKDIDLYETKYFRYISYENVVKMMLTYCESFEEKDLEKVNQVIYYYISKLASFREELEAVKSDLGWKYLENIPEDRKSENVNFIINHSDGVIIYQYELV